MTTEARNTISLGLFTMQDFVRPEETDDYHQLCKSFWEHLPTQRPTRANLRLRNHSLHVASPSLLPRRGQHVRSRGRLFDRSDGGSLAQRPAEHGRSRQRPRQQHPAPRYHRTAASPDRAPDPPGTPACRRRCLRTRHCQLQGSDRREIRVRKTNPIHRDNTSNRTNPIDLAQLSLSLWLWPQIQALLRPELPRYPFPSRMHASRLSARLTLVFNNDIVCGGRFIRRLRCGWSRH
jgi:hypothetical protein